MRTLAQRYSYRITAILLLLAVGIVLPTRNVSALDNSTQGFALQVTPSPLVATVKPGETTNLELRIRNTNSQAQTLKMGLRSFSVDEKSGKVNLGNSEPADVKDFVSFSNPIFMLDAGAIQTQKIAIKTPKNAGFSYSFAITVARQSEQRPQNGSAAIEGSVAVFTLLNVDRPGAQRKFELGEFSSRQHIYEFLPADLQVKLKNTGNTLVQPKGNIYIQRHSNDSQPIAVLPLNQAGGYILPNTSRVLDAKWDEGFPSYQTVTNSDGTRSDQKLHWNFNDASKLRFGKYVAKVVAVYDDGQHDVPVTAEISFWVIPWRIIGGATLLFLLIGIGVYTLIRRSAIVIKRAKKTTPDA